MQMDVGLDTGDMLHKRECDIKPEDTSGSLHDRLAVLGGEALIEGLEAIKSGQVTPEKQDDSLTCYADKLTKQEGEVDWTQDASVISLRIPWFIAMAWSLYSDPSRGNEDPRCKAT